MNKNIICHQIVLNLHNFNQSVGQAHIWNLLNIRKMAALSVHTYCHNSKQKAEYRLSRWC